MQAYEELNYEGAEKISKGPILPAKRTQKLINGQKTDLIYFLDESPLAKIAKAKGQILTFDISLLEVPNRNNTRLVVMLKNYALRRVLECKQHSRNLKPVITLEDIFKKCRITDKDRKTKLRARETLEKLLAELSTKNIDGKPVIKSYEWIKKVNKFYSIKLIF